MRILHEFGDDRRHIQHRRDQVVGEVCVLDHAVFGLDLLHEGESEALRCAAFDLSLVTQGVEHCADIVGGDKPPHLDLAGLRVHLHLGDLGAKGGDIPTAFRLVGHLG